MSESEEIDIEEHDVLDHPAIRRIFPDLSVIKREISQDYDEAINTPSATPQLEDLCERDAMITTESEAQLPNRLKSNNACVSSSTFLTSDKQEASRELMSESEEIDIEEHDVLDHPAIRRIFPDLSVIKREISQDYDEAINTPSATPQLEDLCERDAMITTESEAQLPNRLKSNNACVSSSTFLTSDKQEASRYLQKNVIILGSKPNLEFQETCNNSLRKAPNLVIKDINYFLNSCKRYCKECLILFPNAHSFSLHMINIHFKRNNPISFMGSKVSDKLFKCNVCNRFVSTRCNLLRHFRNLHGDVKALKTVDKIGASEVSQPEESTEVPCFHCHQLFATRNSLIEHLYKILEIDATGPRASSIKSADAKEQEVENFNMQLNEDEFAKDFDKSDISCFKNEFLNSPAHCSNQKNTDSHDVDEHILSQTIQPKRRLAECSDENLKKKNHKSNTWQDGHENPRKKMKMQKCEERLNSKNRNRSHSDESNNNNKSLSKAGKEKKDFKDSKKPSHIMYYKCFICSKYLVTYECFSRHIINDHRIKEVPKVSKVPFDSQCKFCASKTAGINSYNAHLFKYHKLQLKADYFSIEELPGKKRHERVDNNVQCALKSILYKCMQCNLFFLFSDAAIDHSKHLGISDTWKCPFCQRVFRSESTELHKKQHSFSQSFTVHTLAEAAFGLVLYKCSNCTVHYTEKNFLLHYSKCNTETPDSSYCKVCDILINRNDMEGHIVNHTEKQKQFCDFIIIESDIIDDKHTSKKNTLKSDAKDSKHISTCTKKKYCKTRCGKQINDENLENSKLAMSFCHTCKCFIYNLNLRMLHVQGKCGHMLKYACKDCGLMLTTKILATHKQYHKKEQLTLHDFIFYDLKTKKRICPPIPDYPKCNSCGVHFLRNYDVRLHSCQEQEFISCKVCSMKFTEQAYKLHIHFHSYSIPSINTKLPETTLPADPSNETSCGEPNMSVSDDSYNTNVMFFYKCKSCRLTVHTYDKVVQHCQDHYDSKVALSDMQKCQNCTFILLTSDYKNHNMLHLNETFNMDCIKVVDFDPFYFRYNNDFWTNHIFAYLADEDISQILRNSIYMYECRLKMETIQSGLTNSVLYRCDKCQVFVDPQYLYMHAANTSGKSCAKMRKHPCSLCGQNFVSLADRTAHERDHKNINIKLKSYKVVLYNKQEHETYNKIIFDASSRYVLYQCRNCERTLDKFERNAHICDENNLKICSICGLLFDKQDFDLHSIRHEELDKFNVPNIFVVMFGKPKLCNHQLRSSFSGTKIDYTIYQCKKCDLCITTKECLSQHVCVLDSSKCKCSNCGLYFPKPDIECHHEFHENNLDFDELSMNVITFDTSSKNLHVNSKQKLEENKKLVNKTEHTSISPEKLEIVYKCDCGLHFLEELNAQQHTNICNARMKISKQTCIKCGLLFSPGELFNHLLKHHSDKTLQFKYDIILVTKKDKQRVNCKNK